MQKFPLKIPWGGVHDSRTSLRAVFNGAISTSAWDKLYKRNLWSNIRFPAGQNYEDIEVIYKITEICEKFCILDKPLYMYRERPGSITKTPSLTNFRDSVLADLFVFEFIEARFPEIFKPQDLQRCLRMSIVLFLRCSEKSGGEFEKLQETLKNKIFRLEQKAGIKNCDFKTRLAYRMFKHCPQLLKCSYRFIWPFFRMLRNFLEFIRLC